MLLIAEVVDFLNEKVGGAERGHSPIDYLPSIIFKKLE
jgi:hypothetical protein